MLGAFGLEVSVYILDWLLPLVLVGWILLAAFSSSRYSKDLIFLFNIPSSSALEAQ